ncbi:hypothetical protein [Neorhizobium sp. DT-125]|uniref:hypothetical protein n=1 Tax=Neorhizobium sp. DT-125 TaxID=3396163 RepID=UPI003F1D49C6
MTVYAETVLERVLLAIIKAHPSSDTDASDLERLDMAMTALIGAFRPDTARMEQALLFMVRQRQRDACDFEMSAFGSHRDEAFGTIRSMKQLAALAAREVIGLEHACDIQSAAHLLYDAYRGRNGLNSVEYDHVREAREDEAVRRICDELAEWDIATLP